MHTQSQPNGQIALNPPASFGRIRRRHWSVATSPRAPSGRTAERTDSAPLRDEIDAYALHALAANGFGDAIVDRPQQPMHPTRGRLDPGARVHRSRRLTQIVETTLRTVADVARRMYARWKQQRVARATYVALSGLDTRTLRDLGFDRSEISSVAAEVAGAIDSTRTRLARTVRRLPL